jgi:hypothetical protein
VWQLLLLSLLLYVPLAKLQQQNAQWLLGSLLWSGEHPHKGLLLLLLLLLVVV